MQHKNYSVKLFSFPTTNQRFVKQGCVSVTCDFIFKIYFKFVLAGGDRRHTCGGWVVVVVVVVDLRAEQ
jgi:hypothetical protein